MAFLLRLTDRSRLSRCSTRSLKSSSSDEFFIYFRIRIMDSTHRIFQEIPRAILRSPGLPERQKGLAWCRAYIVDFAGRDDRI